MTAILLEHVSKRINIYTSQMQIIEILNVQPDGLHNL